MSTGAPSAEEILAAEYGHHPRGIRKMDISAGVAGAVAASRAVNSGSDVSRLRGWSVRETTGAAGAAFRLHDGQDANGDLLATVGLLAGASDHRSLPGNGVCVERGRIFIEILAGSVEGVLYYH